MSYINGSSDSDSSILYKNTFVVTEEFLVRRRRSTPRRSLIGKQLGAALS